MLVVYHVSQCLFPARRQHLNYEKNITVFQKKTPTHIIELRNSCLILIIFDIIIPHII